MGGGKTRPERAPAAQGSARIEGAIREQQARIAAATATLAAAAVEDIHQGRVAARRLRSLLKTFRPLLEPRRDRLYRASLRSFAQALGTVREADVRRELLLGLARADDRLRPADRRRLAVLLDDLCIAEREHLRRHVQEPGWAALCRALERHRAGHALFAVRDAELADLAVLAARAWRRPVRLLRDQPETTEELHELRLALKHCRYALEAIADLSPKATAQLLRRLRAAQDCIGEHRDTLLAEHWVRTQERALGRPLVASLVEDLAGRERSLRRQAVGRARKVLAAWQAWRDATRRLRKSANRGPR
jgi:CHAD domain-containing protein